MGHFMVNSDEIFHINLSTHLDSKIIWNIKQINIINDYTIIGIVLKKKNEIF